METSKINPECLSLCFAKLVGLMQDRSSISSAKTCHFTDSFASSFSTMWWEFCSAWCYSSILSWRKRDATSLDVTYFWVVIIIIIIISLMLVGACIMPSDQHLLSHASTSATSHLFHPALFRSFSSVLLQVVVVFLSLSDHLVSTLFL